jgi:hypothetical protein
MRPESGRIGQLMAKMYFSIRPRKKIGILMPMSATTVPAESTQDPARLAVSIPSGMPMRMANSMAATVSSIVAGKRCRKSSVTSRPVMKLVPKSSRTMPAR